MCSSDLIPLKKEMEKINNRILEPSQDRIDAAYIKLTEPILKVAKEGGDEFMSAVDNKLTILDNDIILDGKSMRQIANFVAIDEAKVEEYFHLLISDTGEPINESYEEIIEEFPEFVIKEIISVIDSALKPDYKTVKKN